jgi:iron(III) transport system permease protein
MTATTERPRTETPAPAPKKRPALLRRFDSLSLLRWAVIGFFLAFLALPLLSMLVVAFTGQPVNLLGSIVDADIRATNLDRLREFSLENFTGVLGTEAYRASLTNSLWLGARVAGIGVLICAPIAFGFARTAMPFKRILAVLCTVPIVVPTFIAAAGFIIMFGRTGWATHAYQQLGGDGVIFNVYSMTGITLALLFFLFPFILWPMVAAFKIADAALEDAAASLGARSAVGMATVTLPIAIPGIVSAALLGFSIAFSDFGAAIILAPDALNLIVVQAYREIAGFFNWAAASVLVVVMVAVVGAFFWLQRLVLRGRDYGTLTARGTKARELTNPLLCRLLALWTLLVALIPALALLSVVVQSLATTWGADLLPRGWTFGHYERIFRTSSDTIVNSLVLAAGALAIAIVVAATVAYFTVRRSSGTLDFMANIPLIVPGIALGIALIQTFNTAPAALYGTAILLVIGYAIRRLPYMIRSTVGTMQAIGGEVEEAARSLGATRLIAVSTVVLPLLMPAIFAGSILVFVTVIKETSLTVLMAPTRWTPMSLAVFTSLLRGDIYTAAALSVVLVLIVVALQQVAYRVTKGSLY